MALNSETVNTVLSGLTGPLYIAFKHKNVLMGTLYKRSRVRQITGSMIERTFTGGAPAIGIAINDGFELFNQTRPQRTRRLRVEPARLGLASHIPNRELSMAQGDRAVIDIVEAYPEAVIMGMETDIDSYMLQGVSRGLVFATSELRGLLTLNGQVTTGTLTGTSDGVLDFVAPASQNQTVQSIAKSQADFYYNQYADIPVWAGQGMRTLRSVLRRCASFADNGGPDLCFMDPDVYGNFEDSKLSQVRVSLVEDKTEKSDTMELSLGGAKVYYSPSLLRANFTAPANDGVTYFINSDHVQMSILEDINMTKYERRSSDQDTITAFATWHGNMIFTQLPPHGCVSGGAA